MAKARTKKADIEWTGQVRMLPGPKMLELEKDTQERIKLAVCGAGGVFMMRNSVTPGAKGKAEGGCGTGSSDLFCVVLPHGRFCAIEIKRPKGGVISPEQEKFMAHVRLAGGVAGAAKSVDEALALVAKARCLP